MSRTIDEKVVQMQFDNRQFESNVKTSLSTLDRLKQSLKFTDASKGLENINQASKRCDFSALSNGIETVKMKFSALQVIGVTALSNITNSVINAGKKMMSAITTEPIKNGFAEYETQMNAVQTILANTQKEGTNVEIVNAALDELNRYADKTIYNFTEMTRNIGTFTAAGVKLDTSVSSIKGIANLAAVSGSTSQQASTAMYQLSQAIASGTVKLMDWNSVVNAGMGGQVFQDALIRTSEHLQTGAKGAIAAEGSFRESLKTGWLTTEVLTQTLDQFATAADTQEEYEAAIKKFVDQGYSQEEAKQMADMAKTAGEAATKVKTFTQLVDTLKEALGSGWTESWRLIIGDFEQARELWTQVSDYFSEVINKSSEARNEMLKGWAEGGGREDLIQSFKNAFEGILSIVKPIKEAFRDIFPPMTTKKLLDFTEGLKNLTAKIKISDSTADKLKRTFKGMFSVVSIFGKVLSGVGKAFGSLFSSSDVSGFVDLLLTMTASIGDFLTSLNESFKTDGFTGILTKITGGISNVLKSFTTGISNAVKAVTGNFDGFGNGFSKVGNTISKVASSIWNTVKTVFSWIKDNVSIGDIFAGLAGGGIFVAAKKFSNLINTVKEAFEGLFGKDGKEDSIKSKFSDILDSVHDSIKSFTTGIKATTLLTIAGAIGILSISLKSIAKLEAADIAKSLAAIAAMFVMLNLSFKSINKTLAKYDSKGLIKAGISILLISFALKTLASAIVKLSSLSLTELGKGLLGVGVGLTELCIGLKIIDKVKIKMSTAVVMLALAESCKILADALKKFGNMSWEEIGKGLIGMGGALFEFVAALKILDKVGGMKSIFSGAGLLIAVQSLGKLADGLKKFGNISWKEIRKGLAGMGLALLEVVLSIRLLNKMSGLKSIFASSAIFIVIQGLGKLADGLKKFGDMTWKEIRKGLVGMGGALAEVAGSIRILGKISGLKSIFASGAILIVIQGLNKLSDAFKKFGNMSWSEIVKGLVGMGGALTEVAVITGTLGKLAGFKGIMGSASILITIQGLSDLAEAFGDFGNMSWSEIVKGLVGMGGALTEVAGITGVLGTVAGLPSLIGSGSILIAVQGLGKLADAFKKFGEMSWDEIARGLVGMGGALTEVSVITGALGSIAGLPSLIGSGSILIAVQGLGDLADAFKKFGEMSWDEIERGLSAMGGALGEIALGGIANTLSILGDLSISLVAKPLGDLADSVQKWSGVTVPEDLGEKLASLAGGIFCFTLDGMGAASIAIVAESLGTLADSTSKWNGVTIPGGLEEGLSQIANGVKAFTWAFMGGWSIGVIVEPLGSLAGSIRKWSGVTIPDGIESGLKQIANGIKAFTWAFMGGWSIGAIVDPLGNLASSIRKWSGIKVPDGLESGLKQIANGVKAFSFAFMGGWSLDTINGPLGDLATTIKKWSSVTIPDGLEDGLKQIANGIKAFSLAFIGGFVLSDIIEPIGDLATAVKKWNGVTVPKDLKDGLKRIADGVKEFSWAFIGGWTLDSVTGPLGDLATAVKKWNGVTVPSNIGTQLSNLATGVKSFTGIKDISGTVTSINKIASAMSTLSRVNFVTVSSGLSLVATTFNNFANSTSSLSGVGERIVNNIITPIRNAGPRMSNAASIMMNSFASSITSRSSVIVSAFTSMMSRAVASISNKQGVFNSAGIAMMNGLRSGIVSGSVMIAPIIMSVISKATSNVLVSKTKFVAAGRNLMIGIANGVKSGGTVARASIISLLNILVSSITSKTGQFANAGRRVIQGFCIGLRSGSSVATAIIRSMVSVCASTIRSGGYSSFYSAGCSLADGFASGISANTYKSTAKAKAMAEAAALAAKKALNINSPSKVFRRIAYSIPEGFAQGIERKSWMSEESSEEMANDVAASAEKSILAFRKKIQNGFNAQPTISPVIDLSSNKANLQLKTDVNTSITRPVDTWSQRILDAQSEINSSNNEVIRAIGGLRDDLKSMYDMVEAKDPNFYVDSKVLASSIAKPMNRQLNILSQRGLR